MIFERHIKSARKMFHALPILGLMLCMMPAAVSARAQTLAGRWAASGKPLENGEVQKGILELKQDGDKLSGTLQTLGFINGVIGKATRTHFELYGVGWNDPKPFLVGDLVGGELHATQWGDAMVAHKASRPMQIHAPLIAPPALHDVLYDGLAKTPPMGLNSWNLFACWQCSEDQTDERSGPHLLRFVARAAPLIWMK